VPFVKGTPGGYEDQAFSLLVTGDGQVRQPLSDAAVSTEESPHGSKFLAAPICKCADVNEAVYTIYDIGIIKTLKISVIITSKAIHDLPC
jgi:hypothetical protein